MPRKPKKAAFADDELQSDSREIVLSIQPADDKQLNATQREFNRLIANIEQQKREFERVKAVVQQAREKANAEIAPLFQELKNSILAWLRRLDEIHETMSLTKGQKKTLAAFILSEADNAAEILDDEFVDLLLEKYETDEDIAFRKAREAFANELFEDLFGFNPEDEDAEEKAEAFFEQMHERAAGDNRWNNSSKNNRKETAREKRIKQEAQMEAKDLRSLYTSLAKALHPDLETDPQLREQKTELMKKVTQAYENNDLYELMRLQLEHNAQGIPAMNQVVEDQLKRYCSLLRKQLEQMQTEFWIYTRQSEDAPVIKDFLSYKYDFSPTKFRTRKKKLIEQLKYMQARTNELNSKESVVYFLKVLKKSGW